MEHMDTLDIISVAVHSIVNTIGIVLNVVLLFLIWKRSPPFLKGFSVFLANFAVADLVGCMSGMYMMQRAIPSGWALIFVSSGPCSLISGRACFVGYGVMLMCYAHTMFSFPLSFGYRYWILVRRDHPHPSRLLLALVIIYMPSLLMAVTLPSEQIPDSQARAILAQYHPDYQLDYATVTGVESVLSPWSLYCVILMTVPCFPIYGMILFFRRGVYSALERHRETMSENTRRTHQKLIMALTIQAVLPVFFLLGVTSYLVGQFGNIHSPILEHCTFQLMGMMPMFSPMVTIYYVKPYRQFLVALWRLLTCRLALDGYAFARTSGFQGADGPSLKNVPTNSTSRNVSRGCKCACLSCRPRFVFTRSR